MKRLLITLLVLGMVSSANAVQLSLTADPTVPSAEISGYLDIDYVIVLLDSYEGIDVELGPGAGPGSGPFDPGPGIPELPPLPPWEEIWILISQTPPVAGTFMNISGVAGDTVYAAWFDEASGASGLMGPVTLVPEPMTVALLGLGGLFLLRRRR